MSINNTLNKTAREAVEAVLDYRFENRALLTQAFTRTSYANETKQLGIFVESNEVPEFYGDAILAAVVADYLLENHVSVDAHGMHANYDEGDLTLTKSALTDKRNLSRRIFELGFDKYLLITTGDRAQQVTDSMAEDLFEALCCAVWVDSGRNFGVTRAAVRRLLAPESCALSSSASSQSAAPMMPQKPAKSALQEWCDAKTRRFGFNYEVIDQTGTDDNPTFTVELTVTLAAATGEAEAKDDAEARAMYNAYEHRMGAVGNIFALLGTKWCTERGIEHWLLSENRGTEENPLYETEFRISLTVCGIEKSIKKAETAAAEQALAILREIEKDCDPFFDCYDEPSVTKSARALVKEWCDERSMPLAYELLGQKGPNHNPTFSASLSVMLPRITAIGDSPEEAEEEAAYELFYYLEGPDCAFDLNLLPPSDFERFDDTSVEIMDAWCKANRFTYSFDTQETEDGKFCSAMTVVIARTEGTAKSKHAAEAAAAAKMTEQFERKLAEFKYRKAHATATEEELAAREMESLQKELKLKEEARQRAAEAAKNARMLVKEWCDRNGCVAEYLDEREDGLPHCRTFTVMLSVAGIGMVEGCGKSKNAAKEDAAAQMWEILRTQG